jgi:hypothetical protein
MTTRRAAAVLICISLSASPAFAQDACCDVTNAIVQQATRDVLSEALKTNPALKTLSSEELAKVAGKTFLGADRPDFKAYGYMMLLWYGGKEGRDMVANASGTLATEEERAHLYFVMGLFQLRSSNPKTASTGRDYIRQMRDSGKVTFVNDAMWDQLIKGCRLPS